MSVAQESRPDQIDFTIGHFRQRIQEMTPPLLQTTVDAMRLGKEDAGTPESEAFYAVRIEACETEFLARGMTPDTGAPPPPVSISNEVLRRERARRVLLLRERGWSYSQIQEHLQISQSTIALIVTGRGRYAYLSHEGSL